MNDWEPDLGLGAIVRGNRTTFRVWAPKPRRLSLVVRNDAGDRTLEMPVAADGYRELSLTGAGAGTRYGYVADGEGPFPDPCSRSQPDGVHALSEVVDPSRYNWSDGRWRPPPFEDLVIYECHIGTLTRSGTFASAAAALAEIADIGINAVEVMPIAAFPGRWNWGYDGAALFAPSEAYGGPDGFRAFVDTAHQLGLAVILDVVYNHFGPSGNYTGVYSNAYLTSRYHTPWGDAIDFDGPDSKEVRRFFAENLLHWLHEYHVDGFRFDATHSVFDASPTHILAELAAVTGANRRGPARPYLIAESHQNDACYVTPQPAGYGFDAVWADDFHHAVRTLLTGEHDGYLARFDGSTEDLATTIARGFLYDRQFDPAMGQPSGTPTRNVPWPAFQYCIQNHDQVGNRPFGQRLNATASHADFLAASALLALLPQTPLLFQGQEFLASTPFLYFTDHEPALARLVTEGRQRELAHVTGGPALLIPDPQDPASFIRSHLDWDEARTGLGQLSRNLHRDLIALRRSDPALLQYRQKRHPISATTVDSALVLEFAVPGGERLLLVANFGGPVRLPLNTGPMQLVLASNAGLYGGNGAPPEFIAGELLVPAHATLVLKPA